MRAMTFVSGAAVGAGLMYLLDPDRGEDRRSELRDTLTELSESELIERAVARARNLEPLAAVRGLDVNAMLERPSRMLERSSRVLERPSSWWSSWRRSAEPSIQRGRALVGLPKRRRSSFDAGDWALVGGLLGATIVGLYLGRRAMARRDEI